MAKTFERRALKNNKVKKKTEEELQHSPIYIYIYILPNRNASCAAQAEANGVTFAGPCRKASGMQHAIAAKSAAWHQSSQHNRGRPPLLFALLWSSFGLLVACRLPVGSGTAACCLLHATRATLPLGLGRAACLLPAPCCLLQCRVEFFISFGAAIHLNGNFVSSSSSAASSGNRKCQTNNRTHRAYNKRFLY